MTKALISGIHHVAIIVSDWDVSKPFYCGLLGCTVLAEQFRADRNSLKIDLRMPDGSQLEVFTFPHSPARPTRPEALGLRHLAFRVQNLAAVVERLAEFGVSHEGVRHDDSTHCDFLFCFDPDGLPIEFYES
ncbi:SMU1112c/YaeR family gloxylase I-like metalloprotein [Parachitinimonas caeni]|uniref:VOC family protein n=1 Tax=Parachitinimonas caeni TaxID=3031301 RepID=A0ABT7E1X3_9NEIS|nr:VOC family protein [Parachitinimonas caeni]MDK2126317.1 VOC family protein [Parachitinimonas caeni]